MRFSILLPTRNRPELLRLAIESVTRQDYDDWEIIVSDNCSEQDIAGYVRSLNEPRIKYFRTASFVPVTDNWNNALAKSCGDYVIMLGDDDCLMRGSLRTVAGLLDRFKQPDFVYTSAYLYAYPGVMPGYPDGFLWSYNSRMLSKEPAMMEPDRAACYGRMSLDFRLPLFGYNMQFAIISRKFIDSLSDHGPFFQSPYPDYYAMNVMFLKADRILMSPHRLITIGISPKSFGFYYFNDREQQGVQFLKNFPDPEVATRLAKVILPGTDMNNCWLFAMEKIAMNYGGELGLKVNYPRYRLLQISHLDAKSRKPGQKQDLSRQDFHKLWRTLSAGEKVSYLVKKRFFQIFLRVVRRLFSEAACQRLQGLTGKGDERTIHPITGKYKDILEVYDKLDTLYVPGK